MGYPARTEGTKTKYRTRLEIPAGKVWAARSPDGGCLRIACESGILWVTGEDGQDHLLGPGESFRTSEPVRVVVEALEDATAEAAAMGRKDARWWSFLKGIRLVMSS